MHDFIGDIYSNLTIYYEQRKDYKKAYYCYDRFNAIYDSLAGEKKNKMIYQIQAKYKLGKNTRELEELKIQNQSQMDAIDSAKSIQIYLVAITILVIVLMIATFYLLFKEKNLASELKNKTTELHELNVSKDKFFSIIAHDLKNPFNVLVSYTGILKTDLDLFTKEELQQIISDLNEASENGYNLLQNLLLWTRSQTNRIHILKSNFVLANVLTDVKALAELNLADKEQTLSIEIDPNLRVYADKDMIAVVLRNLVFNAIKFSVKGSAISLRASLTGANVRVDVIDSGIGIAEESMKNLFAIDKNTMIQGTEGETGTGLGLVLCKEFVEKNDGKIWVESKLGEGSVFSFLLPVAKS
jgi:signal transduction histidine kinase